MYAYVNVTGQALLVEHEGHHESGVHLSDIDQMGAVDERGDQDRIARERVHPGEAHAEQRLLLNTSVN